MNRKTYLLEDENSIRDTFKYICKNLKIYIYPFTPGGTANLRAFLDTALYDKEHECGATYKAWAYFLDRLIHSPIYTNNPDEADLFLVPHWEPHNRGQAYHNDLIRPLQKAITSDPYIKTFPKRNHLFIYISDNTSLSERRIPQDIRDHLKKRFIRLSYSGRDYDWGQYHLDEICKKKHFDPQNEIVIPPGIPVQSRGYRNPERNCKYDFFYKGSLHPPKRQLERFNFLKYVTSIAELSEDNDSYFGIHCAGWGIWTARLYNYLNLSIIPIISSDGVILPFESFLDYRSFTIKLLSTTYAENNRDPHPILHLQDVARTARMKTSKLGKEKKMVVKRLYQMQDNTKSASYWLDWLSKDEFRNPFCLIAIELFGFIDERYKRSNLNPVSRSEFFRI